MSDYSLLIVEDEAIIATDLAGRLRRLGYHVAGTTDRGETAVSLARQERPSLVLMDIRLGGQMDGIAAAQVIRRECDLPVVFLTAHADLPTLERAKQAEPFGYIVKPFEDRELRTAIEMALHKHQADRQVREQREWLRVTLASIGDAVMTCDAEARITFLNPVAERLTGWTMAECVGHPIQEVFRTVDGRTRQPLEDVATRVLRERRPVELANHAVLIGEDGRECAIEDSAAPILDATRRVIGAVLVFHDVTEKRRAEEALRQSEEQLRLVLEHSNDAIFWADADTGELLRCNRKAEELTERSRDELAGRHQSELHPPDRDYRRIFREAASVPQAENIEAELLSRSGKRIPVLINSSVVTLGNRRVIQGVFRDIRRLRRAEEALRQNQDRLLLAQKAGHVGVFELDFAANQRYWSDERKALFGLPPTFEPKEGSWSALVDPADRAAAQSDLNHAFRERRREVEQGYRITRPDGQRRWLEDRAWITYDPAGRPLRMVGTTMDITAQVEAKELARRRKRQFQFSAVRTVALLAASLFVLEAAIMLALAGLPSVGPWRSILVDSVGLVVLVSPVLYFFAFRPLVAVLEERDRIEEALRLANETLESRVQDRTASLESANRSLAQEVAERRKAETALVQAHAELEQKVQERTASLRQLNEQLESEVRVRREAEQQIKEAEFRYRTVADFTYDWEYWKSPAGTLYYCSPSCQRVTGYTADELMADAELLTRMILPEDRPVWDRHEREAAAHQEICSIQFRIRTRNGEIRWLDHTCRAVTSAAGQYLGRRGSNRDITERKHAEAESQRLREELNRFSRITVAGQLAASIAHELNQPLGAILCNARAAETWLNQDPGNPAEVRAALEDILSDCQRAGAVIQRLRTLYQKGEHVSAPLQLNDIIRETLDLMHSEFVFKGVDLRLELDPGLPRVPGNQVELQQVILNLAINAVEAMAANPDSPRRLVIRTWSEASQTVRVSISDSGPGLTLEQLARVFEPFFTTKPGGMGMGLALSQSIIQEHAGRLWAVNNPEGGATFHLALPALCNSPHE